MRTHPHETVGGCAVHPSLPADAPFLGIGVGLRPVHSSRPADAPFLGIGVGLRPVHSSRPADAPFLGIGVGLRPVHYRDILARAECGALAVDWFEVLSENYMIAGGKPLRMLDAVCAERPVVLHGVSLNVGGVDPLSDAYLDALDALAVRTEPRWVSDHLCFTGYGGHPLHDLIPLPYCEESITHVSDRIMRVQDRLDRRIAIENVSSYLSFTEDAMPEWEFLARIALRADCGILLDVNNVYVSAHNHGFDARVYIDAIPPERVFQIHLAGHSESPPLLIDTHDHAVCDGVFELYAHTLRRTGPVSTSIEWDDEIPPFDELCREADRARAVLEDVCFGAGVPTPTTAVPPRGVPTT